MVVVAFAALLRLPSWHPGFTNTDEVVYWQLAESLAERGRYDLRDMPILEQLSPLMYDRPVFHHPPLFPALIVPFQALDAVGAARVLSFAGQMLCLLGVALVLRRRVADGASGGALSPVLWLPLVGLALDPVLSFSARKLWMDNLLAGFGTLAMALAFTAGEGPRPGRRLAFAGVFLGLAALTKLTGLVLLPLVALVAYCQLSGSPSRRLGTLLWLLLPVLLLVTPWFLYFRAQTGVFLPTWVKADSWTLDNYPFIRDCVERPWWYYTVKLVLLQPLALVAGVAVVVRRDGPGLLALLWLVGVVGVLTVVSASGVGFLMRHISLAIPAIYLMAGRALDSPQGARPRWVLAGVLCVAYAALVTGLYTFRRQADELRSYFELWGVLTW